MIRSVNFTPDQWITLCVGLGGAAVGLAGVIATVWVAIATQKRASKDRASDREADSRERASDRRHALLLASDAARRMLDDHWRDSRLESHRAFVSAAQALQEHVMRSVAAPKPLRIFEGDDVRPLYEALTDAFASIQLLGSEETSTQAMDVFSSIRALVLEADDYAQDPDQGGRKDVYRSATKVGDALGVYVQSVKAEIGTIGAIAGPSGPGSG